MPAVNESSKRFTLFIVGLFTLLSSIFVFCVMNYGPGEPWVDLYHFEETDQNTNTEKIIETRMQMHEEGKAALFGNFKLQGFFILLSIVVLSKNSKSYDIDKLGIHIPSGLVHATLPACLLYSWMAFGYIFNDHLDNRLILSELLLKSEQTTLTQSVKNNPENDQTNTDSPEPTVSTAPQKIENQITSSVKWPANSQRLLLRDKFLLDAYILEYEDPKHSLIAVDPGSQWINFSIITMFFIFVGVTHGLCCTVLIIGFDRHAESRNLKISYYVLGAVVPILFLASHFQFYFTARHPNGQQFTTLAIALLIMVFSSPYGNHLIRKFR